MSKSVSIKWHNNKQGWGLVSQSLHWLIGIVMIGLIISGIIMTEMPRSPEKFELYGIHKAIGSLVLVFVIARLVWRMANIQPAWPADMAIWQRSLAKISHTLLYILMIMQPASGILMSQAGGRSISIFGWVNVPTLISPSENLGRIFSNMHEIGWLIFAAFISLHVIGALYHLIRRDSVFWRMVPKIGSQKHK